jgi:hypothetical protein
MKPTAATSSIVRTTAGDRAKLSARSQARVHPVDRDASMRPATVGDSMASDDVAEEAV